MPDVMQLLFARVRERIVNHGRQVDVPYLVPRELPERDKCGAQNAVPTRVAVAARVPNPHVEAFFR